MSQRAQMDLHIRFVDDEGFVQTRYISSAFLGRAIAEDLLKAFKDCFPHADLLKKVCQLGMDGPSVNWKMHRLFMDELAEMSDTKLIDIGSCGIHVVHGAMKSGFESSSWGIQKFIHASYYVFRHSPACQAAFTFVTKSSNFPKPFVGVRWLENLLVVEHLIPLLPLLKDFVDAVKDKAV